MSAALVPEEFLGDLDLQCQLIWEAVPVIDQKDPFFFDHPLDHVPGMLLIESALRLAERAATAVVGTPRSRHIGRLQLDILGFCELSSPPTVRLWAADAPGCWKVEFRQDGKLIGHGALRWRGEPPGWPPGRPEQSAAERSDPGLPANLAASPQPVAADLVHRSRPQNVLLGQLREDLTAVMLTPPPGHYFRRRTQRLRSLGELTEAARQFSTLLAHRERDVTLGRQFILKSCDINLDRPVNRAEQVTLHAAELPDQRGRGAGTITSTIKVGGRPVGSASLTGHVVSAAAYRRIREGSR